MLTPENHLWKWPRRAHLMRWYRSVKITTLVVFASHEIAPTRNRSVWNKCKNAWFFSNYHISAPLAKWADSDVFTWRRFGPSLIPQGSIGSTSISRDSVTVGHCCIARDLCAPSKAQVVSLQYLVNSTLLQSTTFAGSDKRRVRWMLKLLRPQIDASVFTGCGADKVYVR